MQSLKLIDNRKRDSTNNPSLTDEKKGKQLKEFEITKGKFEALLDEEKHNELVKRRTEKIFIQINAFAALFINLYRDEPILHLPFRFLIYLVDIDEFSQRGDTSIRLWFIEWSEQRSVQEDHPDIITLPMETAEKHKVFMICSTCQLILSRVQRFCASGRIKS